MSFIKDKDARSDIKELISRVTRLEGKLSSLERSHEDYINKYKLIIKHLGIQLIYNPPKDGYFEFKRVSK